MSTLRLRVLKRHTSLEADLEAFYEAELHTRDGQPDLSLSVFDIETDCLVQTHAEYVVSLLEPPARARGGLSVDGCEGFDPRSTPGATLFEYTTARHIELHFLREGELRLVAEQLHRERKERRRSTDGNAVLEYGRGRLRASDEEWLRACTERPKWKRELERVKTAKTKSGGAAGRGERKSPESVPPPDGEVG